MDGYPPWLLPVLGALGSALGAWIAVKVTVARLEVQMGDTLTRVTRHGRRLAVISDDLLTHDFEIGTAFEKLQLKRANRQVLREVIDDE